jgi:hypothetical protein
MVLGPALLLVFLPRGLLLVDGVAFPVEALRLEVVALLIHLKSYIELTLLHQILINERAEVNYKLCDFRAFYEAALVFLL